jgi:hypothetical protein
MVATKDVANDTSTIDHKSCWMRDVKRVGAKRVMQPIRFRHDAILVEQKDAGDGMLLQKFSRLPHAAPFFSGDEGQSPSGWLNIASPRLQLSHALQAVRSPCAAKKLQNERAIREQIAESK